MIRICDIDAVAEGDAREFRGERGALVVVHHQGQFHVYSNRCPHLGIELNFNPDDFFNLDKTHLSCANHGALFNIDDGYCVRGPCAGQSLEKHTIIIRDGALFLGDAAR